MLNGISLLNRANRIKYRSMDQNKDISNEITHEIEHLVRSTEDMCLWNNKDESRKDYYPPCPNTFCHECEYQIILFTN